MKKKNGPILSSFTISILLIVIGIGYIASAFIKNCAPYASMGLPILGIGAFNLLLALMSKPRNIQKKNGGR